MTDDQAGVETEEVANPQEAVEEQNDQQYNWNQARETMAEQKKRLEELEERNQTYQQQLAVFQNYMSNSQMQKQVQSEPEISDDDVLTGADLKKVLQAKENQINSQLTKYQRELAAMRLKSKYQDYDNVVGNTLKLAQTDTELAEALTSSSNPGLLAYHIGKSFEKKAEASRDAQRMVENASKPKSLSQAQTGTSGLSKTDYFLNMSDSDFEKHIAKVKFGA